jgi:hypothetical protein
MMQKTIELQYSVFSTEAGRPGRIMFVPPEAAMLFVVRHLSLFVVRQKKLCGFGACRGPA